MEPFKVEVCELHRESTGDTCGRLVVDRIEVSSPRVDSVVDTDSLSYLSFVLKIDGLITELQARRKEYLCHAFEFSHSPLESVSVERQTELASHVPAIGITARKLIHIVASTRS